jgi:methionyl-tRNA formyltransferase
MSQLEHSGTPVIQVRHPVNWSEIKTALHSIKPELLVCYGFMRIIPSSFFCVFTHGGVNFHPALLPAYRGPHPNQCIAADGTFRQFGGLTLHKLSEYFDQGDILAQAKFMPQDYRSIRAYRGVLVSTMIAMIQDILPLYCSGRLNMKQQAHGTEAWARYHPQCIRITENWTADQVAAACAFLRERDNIFVCLPNCRPISITGFRKRLGCASGIQSILNPFSLDFDCADARISVLRNNRMGRFIRRISNKFEKLQNFDIARQIDFEPCRAD